MKIQYFLVGIGLAVGVTACSGTPGMKYPLSADRLAWQPYREGQVLRFANSRTTAIRAYTVTQVADYTVKERLGINWVPLLGSRKPREYQNVDVTIQRPDSVGYSFTAVGLNQDGDPSSPNGIFFRATVGWDGFSAYDSLPIDSVNKGAAFDSLRYPGIRLVQSATFGGITYGPVLRILPFLPSTPVKGALRVIIYAKGAGVVAFEETGRGLWYRLP